jgi:hypothetical protein
VAVGGVSSDLDTHLLLDIYKSKNISSGKFSVPLDQEKEARDHETKNHSKNLTERENLGFASSNRSDSGKGKSKEL